ncbi:hypothetical protein X949_5978 [Burkholderia pseudomallei MSHR5609]|nr:hypothetical protein X945_6043 [Burkholderia pseudomallei ABCPW 107]KGS53042.1 hypothetical protein X949_5978 [Burkholderia pseudomallei MSHR5609]
MLPLPITRARSRLASRIRRSARRTTRSLMGTSASPAATTSTATT